MRVQHDLTTYRVTAPVGRACKTIKILAASKNKDYTRGDARYRRLIPPVYGDTDIVRLFLAMLQMFHNKQLGTWHVTYAARKNPLSRQNATLPADRHGGELGGELREGKKLGNQRTTTQLTCTAHPPDA